MTEYIVIGISKIFEKHVCGATWGEDKSAISYLLFCQTCSFSFERLLKLSFESSSSSVAVDLSLHPGGVQKNCQ